ncbi:hypothetical protein IM538_07450 [Cytobacillus suaedae]|nr:hypothetical protein IM538_07450 [Cytobacillus suaedae]
MRRTFFTLAASTLLFVGLAGCAGDKVEIQNDDDDARILKQGSHEKEDDPRSHNQNEILHRDRELLNEERNYYHDRLDKGNRPNHNKIEDIRNRNNSILDIGPL